MKESIVISGIGIISVLGLGIEPHMVALKSEKVKIKEGIGSNFEDITGIIDNINVKKYVKNKKSIRFFNKQTKLACSSAKIAIEDAKLTEEDIKKDERMNGLILGGAHSKSLIPMADALASCVDKDDNTLNYSKVGQEGYRNLSPLWILSRLPNTSAGQVTIENGIKGLNYTVVNGVNSGIVSIGEAFLAVKQDRQVRIICGGAEDEVFPDFVYELKKDNLIADCADDNKVFGKKSKGYLCAEGSSLFVVEKEREALKRNANIYGEIIGYSNYYIPNLREIKSEEEIAVHMEKSMRNAIKMADIAEEDVDFIQASAGGLVMLDHAEAIAIKEVFSKNVYITETQSYVGNTLSASGAVSVAFACLHLKNNFIAPISENDDLFLDDELNYVKGKYIDNDNKICIVNSFSYLGELCTLVLRKK
ncbi:beta-ketoacyl-[acyl-carrier-protein] synthase family protein [Clostridium felsineum]|uniref:3-oxoacyl-[acyl-carrier-protein] synthase 2 n=1 Tax=Clostridium felsineum TaxID=36839 RepID=A0A1S8MDM9_9CLOT|nr:beta-ketoacyl synthase [Clostridium felsineum]URZ06411.1 3-oxoacyl-[acyl-carrier-protein] synthase 2 [Clostridium felsineum]URZ11446.1 3-oxoacyl-[acyl-carrier-protein] synthase 2 [Clostridium felsineum]